LKRHRRTGAHLRYRAFRQESADCRSRRSKRRPGREPAAGSARGKTLAMTTGAGISSRLLGQIPLLTLVGLCFVTTLLTDRFLTPINLSNILVQSSVMAVIAMGMTFVIIGGGFDLSVGSTAALSACTSAMVMLEAGI